MSHRYILNAEGEPEPCDLMTWARWMEDADRIVAQDRVGNVRVSTVFLGLDHSFGGDIPLYWETMVFPDAENGNPCWRESHCQRCGWSRANAVQQHADVLAQVKSGQWLTAERYDLDDEA